MPPSRRVGPATIIALQDAVGLFPERREEAFPAATPEQWRRADERDPAAVTAEGRWRLPFRCFAIRLDDGNVIMVDAGIGPAGSPAASWTPVPGRLPDELAAAGIDPSEVRTVVLTHLHSDHIGWAVTGDPKAPYFDNARYLMQRTEIETIRERAPAGLAEHLLDPLTATGQLVAVDGTAQLAPGLRLLATPGHTPGHQSVLLETGDETVVLTGDLLVHAVQLVDPELPYAHEMDPVTARASRVALLDDLARRAGVLATPHLGEPFVPVTSR
jgi:glyoxylase-like metal-dependent hydrolase (beta-lactamase superfamily II)